MSCFLSLPLVSVIMAITRCRVGVLRPHYCSVLSFFQVLIILMVTAYSRLPTSTVIFGVRAQRIKGPPPWFMVAIVSGARVVL